MRNCRAERDVQEGEPWYSSSTAWQKEVTDSSISLATMLKPVKVIQLHPCASGLPGLGLYSSGPCAIRGLWEEKKHLPLVWAACFWIGCFGGRRPELLLAALKAGSKEGMPS